MRDHMKKLLLLLSVFVIHVYGMEQDYYDDKNQNPYVAYAPAPVSLLYDQYGNPLVYDHYLGTRRLVYTPGYPNNVPLQDTIQYPQDPPLATQAPVYYEEPPPYESVELENCEDIPLYEPYSQERYSDLKNVFSQLARSAFDGKETQALDDMEQVENLLKDTIAQIKSDASLASEDKQREQIENLLYLFNVTSAYTWVSMLMACDTLDPGMRSRLKGTFGLLLTYVSQPDSQEFKTGYDYLFDAVGSGMLPDEVKKKFRARRKICDELRYPDRPKIKKKKKKREDTEIKEEETAPEPLLEKDESPQEEPLQEVPTDQVDQSIQENGDVPVLKVPDNNTESSKDNAPTAQKKKKKKKKKKQKKEIVDIAALLGQIKSNECKSKAKKPKTVGMLSFAERKRAEMKRNDSEKDSDSRNVTSPDPDNNNVSVTVEGLTLRFKHNNSK